MVPPRAWLVLQDGSRFEGQAFGAHKSMAGEVVFQTGMVGYPESLTDPSYTGQILCLTFPMIGNYGVPSSETLDAFGLPAFMESSKVHVTGLIVADLSVEYSHWNAAESLSELLAREGVPGITGIDTRELTKKLRVDGSMLGKIVVEGDTEPELYDPNTENLVAAVSCKEPRVFNPDGDVHIMAVDVGLKNNQIRCLASRGAKVTLVPYDYDFASADYDGLFLSNGPGDPTMASKTIQTLKTVIARDDDTVKPIFGICLGHQLLTLACGAKTFKMQYGNRGHNQPCTEATTGRCYITSQNHGFAADTATLPPDWVPLFTNENDKTNEGICHASKPFFSVQFHPEATAGPEDLECLFDVFLNRVRGKSTAGATMGQLVAEHLLAIGYPGVAAPPKQKKVVILGSGGLSIGQAGEFDYSGSQAIKALKEEGVFSVLINPNIATVQTMKGLADKVYFLPVTPDYVERVIERERPSGVLLAFGGQTALNCGIELNKRGVFEKHNVRVLGTAVQAIVDTEDREIFSGKLAEINESCVPNVPCFTVDEVVKAAEDIGYPVMMRASFALGGLGSGVVDDKEGLLEQAKIAFANSPQVVLEKSLRGWKEVEYEVVRDRDDNCITVCNMENFDPLGVHTGESIVIAPSQTLDNYEYNMLRNTAIKVVRHIGVVGECNIQYALDPNSRQYYIIEVNARLSRSSALASKATGYPLAYVAAKLALGATLPVLRNSVTRKTTACFEPSLDYCVVKIPRWDLAKFPTVSKALGTSMKSVGEVMAIGRTFEEAFQKALRMVDSGAMGFDEGRAAVSDEGLRIPSEERPFVIASALSEGMSVARLADLTRIDKWFLERLANIMRCSAALKAKGTTQGFAKEALLAAKKLGFSDKQIAVRLDSNEVAVRVIRKGFGLRPWVKQIDTVAAEYPAYTNYLYVTYNGASDDVPMDEGSTIVLGSGVYRIGSSVEFDYCAVGCVRELRNLGHKTIMINYNPETVSTDYDECDRLYFDELSFETVMDIYEMERARGIVLSMGGQIPNNIASALAREDAVIFGTHPTMIDGAENRYKFSRMCDSEGIDQPQWKELASMEDARAFAKNVTYPVLMRPSYILSGTAMRVAHNDQDLESAFKDAVVVSREFPVVLTKFIKEAKEIEADCVADNGNLIVCCISEHVENAGVHSGDATLVHPAQDLTPKTIAGVKDILRKIARALRISGPFNTQFIAKDDKLKVIETNVRVSRSFPFVSKTANLDLIQLATRVMVGEKVTVPPVSYAAVGVKVPQFSFNRLAGTDPQLGVDMISTGEVACFGDTREEAYLKATVSTSFVLPKAGASILLSIGGFAAKQEFLASARTLEAAGYVLHGSLGTADFLSENGVKILSVDWMGEDEGSIAHDMLRGKFELVIMLATRDKYRRPATFGTAGQRARRMAIDMRVPLITNIKVAKLFVNAICSGNTAPEARSVDCRSTNPLVRLPGFIDVHVPVSLTSDDTPNALAAVTRAALIGGVTGMCCAPINSEEAISALTTDSRIKSAAAGDVPCDYGVFLRSSMPPPFLKRHAARSLGLLIDDAPAPVGTSDLAHVRGLFQLWTVDRPIVVTSNSPCLAAVLYWAQLFKRAVHVAGITLACDIDMVVLAREKGACLTCSVAVTALFPAPGDSFAADEAEELWSRIGDVDAFTAGGPAALPVALALLVSAVSAGQMTLDDLRARVFDTPAAIFGITGDEASYVELAVVPSHNLQGANAGPFSGLAASARVSRVVMHGNMAVLDGEYGTNDAGERFEYPYSEVRARATSGTLVTATGGAAVLPAATSHPGSVAVFEAGTAAAVVAAPAASVTAARSPSRSGSSRRYTDSGSEPGFEIEGNKVPGTISTVRPALAPAPLNRLVGQHILSVKQFSKTDLHHLFNTAHRLRQTPDASLLKGKVLASLFFEPSTRTSSSFVAAMERLGGSVISINQAGQTSLAKGETLRDTVKTMECYADAIVMRHPGVGSTHDAAKNLRRTPLISGGDGVGEHPTQALLDVYTIREELGTVNGLNVTLVGDLKNGRTVHSLAQLISKYRVSLRYVAPKGLEMPQEVVNAVKLAGIPQSMHTNLSEVLADTDVLYVTRVQRERFESEEDYDNVCGSYCITPKVLKGAKDNMIVMHPLPRVGEISDEVDTDPRAAYFRQMEHGVYLRMALLASVLGAV